MSIYDRFALHDRVHIESRYVNKHARASVINTLKNRTEGVCSKHGFVRPGSVSIRAISFGVFNVERGGGATFDVTFDAEVCNPRIGSTIRCRVENWNATAAFATNVHGERVIDMIIPPRPRNFAHEYPFDSVKVGDVIDVAVVGKRFHLGQSRIICAGQIASSPIPDDDDPMNMSSVDAVAEAPLTALTSVTARAGTAEEDVANEVATEDVDDGGGVAAAEDDDDDDESALAEYVDDASDANDDLPEDQATDNDDDDDADAGGADDAADDAEGG